MGAALHGIYGKMRGLKSRNRVAVSASFLVGHPATGICSACAGKHRAHTCGKKKIEKAAVKEKKKAPPLHQASIVVDAPSPCLACAGAHKKHTCGKERRKKIKKVLALPPPRPLPEGEGTSGKDIAVIDSFSPTTSDACRACAGARKQHTCAKRRRHSEVVSNDDEVEMRATDLPLTPPFTQPSKFNGNVHDKDNENGNRNGNRNGNGNKGPRRRLLTRPAMEEFEAAESLLALVPLDIEPLPFDVLVAKAHSSVPSAPKGKRGVVA